ncbi:MAG: hypothetical protein H0W53_21260, partial [Acidobacteria bacterium]|nr:hypothetical protein [Acidobacteriota bacterium]
MLASSWRRVIASSVLTAGLVWPVLAAPQAPPAPPQEVPSDLESLLGAPQSEMRLVVQRYTLDRNTLNGNYLAGGRGGGLGGGGRGRGDAPPAATPGPAPAVNLSVSLSPNRIARLKRFDLDWQAGLAKLDAGELTPAGREQLGSLQQTITANMQQLDADATAIAEVMPLVPFAPEITTFVEHRIRMGDMDGRRAAASIDAVTRQIAAVKQKLQDGLGATPTKDAMRANREIAMRAADSVDALRANVSEWFNHYNLYDPLFTWWVPLPYGHADNALVEYAAFLRGPVAAAGHQPMNAAPAGGPIAVAPAPKLPSVPDLAAIIALPQDEMAPVVQRFLGRPAGGRGGASPDRAPEYYRGWLA